MASAIPSRELFWGLTGKDFKDSLWDVVYIAPTFFVGLAVAGTTNVLAQLAFKKKEKGSKYNDERKGIIITLSTTAGLATSFYVGNFLSRIQCADAKSFRFLFLTCVPILTYATYGGVGSCLGYMGSALILKRFKSRSNLGP